MPTSAPKFVLAGRFPPPVNGQTVITQRLWELLDGEVRLERVAFGVGDSDVAARDRLHPTRPLHIARYRRAIRESGADVLLYSTLSGSRLGHLRDLITFAGGGVPARTRVVAWVHNGNIAHLFRSPWTRRSARALARRIDLVVAPGKIIAGQLAPGFGEGKLRAIPFTIREETVCTPAEVEAALERRGRPGELAVLYLSNMIAGKGYPELLEAVGRLAAEGVAVRADFVGTWFSDDDRRAFEERARALGIADRVHAHGPVYEPERLKRHLLAADLFAFPTRYRFEASPIAVIEALNAGLPVVTTAHAGIPDLVENGVSGRFVAPGDPADLAARIGELADRSRLVELARGARHAYDERHSAVACRTAWLDLLGELQQPVV